MAPDTDSILNQNRGMYICMGVYFAILVVVAVVAFVRKRRASKESDGLDAHFGGTFSAPMLVLTTFSTIYSGFTVTGVPSEAYRTGFRSVRWIGATFVVVLGMLLVYPRLRRIAVVRDYKSPSDFVTDRFRSRRLRVIAALCAVLPLLVYLLAQLVSFASMLSGLTGGAVPKPAGIVFFAVTILVLEKLGGMNAVVLTDSVQSAVMVVAFVTLPWVLGSYWGFVPQFSPAECSSLRYVANVTVDGLPPAACNGPGEGCLPAGCLAAVRPEFFKYPGHHEQCSMVFFLLNMVAAPLQPHMIQRTYIAGSDRDLKVVMLAMLVAPFLAQTPGIIIGLTKAAYEPEWGMADQEATAFAAVSSQMLANGGFQYLLATVLSCSALAAIMSTADSVLMGASCLISVDIYKGVVRPEASTKSVVRLGELNSVIMAALASVGGLFVDVDSFGWLITVQNGLAMQLLPAYGLGLYFGVRERGIVAGILVGLSVLLVLVVLVDRGRPPEMATDGAYVPRVNLSVAANFLTVLACELLFPGSEDRPSGLAQAMQKRFGDPLRPSAIRGIMSSTREPPAILLGLMVVCLVASIPFYHTAGIEADTVFGVPVWCASAALCYLAVAALGAAAVLCWAPSGFLSGYESELPEDSSTESEEDSPNKSFDATPANGVADGPGR